MRPTHLIYDKAAHEAFIEQCYELYEQRLYFAALRILRDEDCAEDAVHDVFCRLITQRVYFADPRSEYCLRYLTAAVRNASLDILRRRRDITDELPADGACSALIDPSPEEKLGVRDELTRLLDGLPPRYGAVVECLAVRDMSVRDAASALGLTEAAVRKRWQRAREMMKNNLKGYD